MAPVSRVNVGVPVTVTASEKLTCMEIAWAALYEPFKVDEFTLETLGAVVSTTTAELAPSDPAAPGQASKRAASNVPVAESLIVPLFREKGELVVYTR